MAHLAPRMFQLRTNHLVWVLCRPVWVTEACQLFLVPSRSSSTPLYPSKCCELGSVPRLLFFSLFFTWTHISVFQGVGSASHGVIVHINTIHQLQSSCSFNTKATPIATQLKLTIPLQLVIMVKLWLLITVYTLHTYAYIKCKVQLMCNTSTTMKYYDVAF
jgi:hypothetical protein